ncbi:MAG: potassium channel family protein [Muribaculaceae bacterium]|nr:two pore domain potassium channel family protein [Bacteroides sp.]MDE6843005.1 potassium channel family protein [Muribaculaceae bacterium]
MSLSDRIRHLFHVVSNVRPLVWICIYIGLMPFFALIYWALPDGQFRIPDGGGVDYGSWLYYSIVTITTLGFGDYTPAHAGAQAVTAVEVMCGLVILGFFLNAVGSMKSEIDVTSELERQRKLHEAQETDKLKKTIPVVMHCLNNFMAYCYAVTTPLSARKADSKFNPDFSFSDMADLYKPSHLPSDLENRPAVEGLLRSAHRTSLCLDSLQTRVDLELWPELLESCFTFVANSQMFTSSDRLSAGAEALMPASGKDAAQHVADKIASSDVPATRKGDSLDSVADLYYYIKANATLARQIETALTKIASSDPAQS